MQKKNWLIPGAGLILAAAILFAPHTSASGKTKNCPSTCCSRSSKPCNATRKNEGPARLIMENLSRQFIAFGLITY